MEEETEEEAKEVVAVTGAGKQKAELSVSSDSSGSASPSPLLSLTDSAVWSEAGSWLLSFLLRFSRDATLRGNSGHRGLDDERVGTESCSDWEEEE